jgi:hypothetical protein
MQHTHSPTLQKIGTLAAAVGLALGAATQPVSAADGDITTFLLTSDHCTGTCGGGDNPQASFGSIVVTDLAGSALGFTVTLFNGNKFVQTGLDLTFGFNLVANATITYSGLSAGFNIPGGTSPLQSAGIYHENGTGDFDYGVIWGGGPGGGNADSNPVLSFTISGAGLTLASLEQNGAGQFFAADILSGTTGFTGAVDASQALPPTSVPEPETYAMLLAGLGMMGFIARRRKHRAV